MECKPDYYYFKEDYTIIPKPRAVIYKDRNDQRKLMRLNELHKFSDGMLTKVMEKLDQMVKGFHLYEYNKGMETRKWSEDDKRRSKDFITAIEKRLQIRRIYQSLESFVGGRIRDIDYRLINRTTDQFLHDKPTEDDQEKSKAREESGSTIPDPSHQTGTSSPPVIPPFTEIPSSKPSSLVTPPPINTEATTITTSLPEITPFIALQLRVARLEQEMSEVKKTDHSVDVLASIRTQVPTAVDNYLGTKLDDALLKVLERHTADLIEKYSVLPGPESVKNQESKKSPKEIIKAKKEQDEEKQDSTYSIRSTDKVDLEEFDLKSALFSHMNKKKSANKNTTNYRLYHALMEALIADEDAMDKEVADKVKDHKRKHDSDDDEDDDDDEGPSAGSNQGRSTKRRRSDSAASGSAKPPPKDDDQSSQKPRESDASASKQHPSFTSTGWQITDTRDTGADSSMHRSDPESEHSEQSSDDISKQDEGNDSDMEDTDNAHIPKVSTTTWFKPIPESERPATPEPEWTISPNDFPEPEHNWANAYATTYKVPEENKLQRKTYDIGSFIKWFCRRTGKKKLCKADLEGPTFNLVKAFHKNSVFLQYQMDECHKLLTNKVDWSNPEGHQILRNIYEPLPLGGPPGQVTIQPQFFFNRDLDYLLTGDKERRIALSISKLKAARYLDFGLEELVPSLWVESEREYDISAVYGITHWWFRRKEFYINKHSESSDREAVRSHMRILSVPTSTSEEDCTISPSQEPLAWSRKVVRGMDNEKKTQRIFMSLPIEKRITDQKDYQSLGKASLDCPEGKKRY
ncbi:hypothetical protein Tco_0593079 [Tanacetum coccineum]